VQSPLLSVRAPDSSHGGICGRCGGVICERGGDGEMGCAALCVCAVWGALLHLFA